MRKVKRGRPKRKTEEIVTLVIRLWLIRGQDDDLIQALSDTGGNLSNKVKALMRGGIKEQTTTPIAPLVDTSAFDDL